MSTSRPARHRERRRPIQRTALTVSLLRTLTLSGTLLSLAVCPAAHAQKLWDGGAGVATPFWDLVTNWAGDTLPLSTEDVQNNTALSSTFRQGSQTINSFLSQAAFTLSGGTLTANSPGASTLQVNNTFSLSGGTLSGFVVNAGSGGQGITLTGSASVLNSVTLNAGLSATSATVMLATSNTTGATNVITLTNGANLRFQGANTLGNGTINFSGTSASNLQLDGQIAGGTALTINSGTTLSGRIGILGQAVFSTAQPRTITNNGTITSNVSGNTTTIQAATFTNNSLLQAMGGADLTLSGTTFINNATGTVSVTGGGTLTIGSDLANAGTVSINAGAMSVSGATLSGVGSYSLTNGSALSMTSATLNGAIIALNGGNATLTGSNILTGGGGISGANTITLNGSTLEMNGSNVTANTITLNNGSNLRLRGNTNNLNTLGGVTLDFTGTSASNLQMDGQIAGGTALTIANNTSLSGRIGILGQAVFSTAQPRTITNNGTITSNVSGNTATVQSTTFTNNGTLQATGGANLALSGTTFTNNATGTVAIAGGGTLSITGDLANAGTVSANASLVSVSGATLSGAGNYSLSNGSSLSLISATLDGANIAMGGGNVTATGSNVLTGGGSISGAGTITATGSTLELNGGNLTANTLVLNNGSNLRLRGNTNNLNTLNSAVSFTGTSASNVQLDGQIAGGTAFTIGNTATLSGRIGILGQAVFSTAQPRTITNNGTITSNVSGNTTTIQGSSFSNNATGVVEALSGATVAFNTDTRPTNAGALRAGSSSTITLNDGLTQTGGQTIVDGTLTVVANQTLALQGGRLLGTGTITTSGTGLINNSGGTVNPGDSPGTLTINGAYTQGTGGTLLIELGGASAGQFDVLSVSGAASLGGALNVSLVNGFGPSLFVGEAFTFLNYGSRTGAFAAPISLDAGYGYSVSYGANSATLTVTQVAPVSSAAPEPGTFALLGIGMIGMFGIATSVRNRTA